MQQNQQNTDSMFCNSIKTEELGRRILRLSCWSQDAPHKLISKQGEIWQQISKMIRYPLARYDS